MPESFREYTQHSLLLQVAEAPKKHQKVTSETEHSWMALNDFERCSKPWWAWAESFLRSFCLICEQRMFGHVWTQLPGQSLGCWIVSKYQELGLIGSWKLSILSSSWDVVPRAYFVHILRHLEVIVSHMTGLITLGLKRFKEPRNEGYGHANVGAIWSHFVRSFDRLEEQNVVHTMLSKYWHPKGKLDCFVE